MNTETPTPPVLTRHICFHAWNNGFLTQERERVLLEDVAAQVTAWLNQQGAAVNVLHIATNQTDLGAYATVWFKSQP